MSTVSAEKASALDRQALFESKNKLTRLWAFAELHPPPPPTFPGVCSSCFDLHCLLGRGLGVFVAFARVWQMLLSRPKTEYLDNEEQFHVKSSGSHSCGALGGFSHMPLTVFANARNQTTKELCHRPSNDDEFWSRQHSDMMNGPQLGLCSLICSLERVGTRPALAWKEQCLLTGVRGGALRKWLRATSLGPTVNVASAGSVSPIYTCTLFCFVTAFEKDIVVQTLCWVRTSPRIALCSMTADGHHNVCLVCTSILCRLLQDCL